MKNRPLGCCTVSRLLPMTNICRVVTAALFLVPTIPGRSAQGQARPEAVRVAVRLSVPLTQSIVDQLATLGQVNHVLWRINMIDMNLAESSLTTIAADSRVRYVERERISLVAQGQQIRVSSDDLVAGTSIWNLDMINVTDSYPDALTRSAPARIVPETGKGVYIAVVDSGLLPNWRDYFDEQSIDSIHARSFITPSYINSGSHSAPSGDEPGWDKDSLGHDGHGTKVTAQILGFHADHPRLPHPPFPLNFNGVAPEAKVIPIRWIMPNNTGSDLDALNAIDYVIELADTLNVRVVMNNSWSLDGPSQAVEDAIRSAITRSVIVVASAGNCGPYDLQNQCSGVTMVYPWAAIPEVISVGAVGWKHNYLDAVGNPSINGYWTLADVPESTSGSYAECYVVSYSSRALPGQELDLMAPANYILVPPSPSGGVIAIGGTSAASPHVAGAAALLLQRNSALSQAQVESILKRSAVPIAPGTSYFDPFLPSAPWGSSAAEQGSGLLQVDKALALVPVTGLEETSNEVWAVGGYWHPDGYSNTLIEQAPVTCGTARRPRAIHSPARVSRVATRSTCG